MIYRLIDDLPPRPNHTEPAAVAGQLLFPWRAGQPKMGPGQLALSAQPKGWGFVIIADKEMVHPAQLTPSDFEQALEFYLSGGAVLPNVEIRTAEQVDGDLNNMACCAGWVVRSEICHIKLPGAQVSVWARAFLGQTQGGQLDGTGTLLLYNRGHKDTTRTVRFALCQHEKRVGAGANPMRGWHPGSCVKCGLNMTVDSGD